MHELPEHRLPILVNDDDMDALSFMRLGAFIAFLSNRRTTRAQREAVLKAALTTMVEVSTDDELAPAIISLARM